MKNDELRHQLAGQAMQALIQATVKSLQGLSDAVVERIALASYAIADDMIDASKRKRTDQD